MLGRDTAVWLIGSLCQVHRVPFAPTLLIQQFPPPYTQAALQRALHAYGFTAASATWRAGAVALPCVAFIKDAPGTPALILHADSERLMYVRRAGRTANPGRDRIQRAFRPGNLAGHPRYRRRARRPRRRQA